MCLVHVDIEFHDILTIQDLLLGYKADCCAICGPSADDAKLTGGASGHCIISIANFDKLKALDAVRKHRQMICKSLTI